MFWYVLKCFDYSFLFLWVPTTSQLSIMCDWEFGEVVLAKGWLFRKHLGPGFLKMRCVSCGESAKNAKERLEHFSITTMYHKTYITHLIPLSDILINLTIYVSLKDACNMHFKHFGSFWTFWPFLESLRTKKLSQTKPGDVCHLFACQASSTRVCWPSSLRMCASVP